MKILRIALLLLVSLPALSQEDERLLVQLQTDKVCVNSDTCFMVRANIVLTTKRLFIVDYGEKESLTAYIRMLDIKNGSYYAYATNDELSAYIYMNGTKIQVDYSFNNQRFLLDYRVKQVEGNYLIKYF